MKDETTNLLGLIDKWGSEHWSAATQKANIELLRDRLKISEEEKKTLTKRADDAEKELAVARETVRQLHARNKELQGKLESPALPTLMLDQFEMRLLVIISGDAGFVPDAAIYRMFPDMKQQRVFYHLERLASCSVVQRWDNFMEGGMGSATTQEGREFLVKHNLL